MQRRVKKNKCTFEKSGGFFCMPKELKNCAEITEEKICKKAKPNCKWDNEMCGIIDFVPKTCIEFTTKEDCKSKKNNGACGLEWAGSCVAKVKGDKGDGGKDGGGKDGGGKDGGGKDGGGKGDGSKGDGDKGGNG